MLLLALAALVVWLTSLVATQRRQIRDMDDAILDLAQLAATHRQLECERSRVTTPTTPTRRSSDRPAVARVKREAIYEGGTTWVQPERLHIRH